MVNEMEPTAQRLREVTDYDPVTGRFNRRAGPKAGKPFRKPRGKKAVRVKIDGFERHARFLQGIAGALIVVVGLYALSSLFF